MKITEIISGNKRSLSFEVFPPKTMDKYDSIADTVDQIAILSPSYMSVTYGAGGGTSEFTAKIAQNISARGVTPLAHLSCITSSKADIVLNLQKLSAMGINNILALRGDIPAGFIKDNLDFHYAYELIDSIRQMGDFCIGGACYPESHPESPSIEADLDYLKIKVDHGCDFLTTQMFFDNSIFYRFTEKLSNKSISVPVVAGIMPVTSIAQLDRMVYISGNELPCSFLSYIKKYENDPKSLKAAGIEYASKQARDLYDNGVNAVHIYTMNKIDVAKSIQDNLKDLLL